MIQRRIKNRNRLRRRRFYRRKRFWLGLLLLAVAGVWIGWVAVDYNLRPYRERAGLYNLARIAELEVPSLILDRNGEVIGRIFVENRSVIEFKEIPQRMIDALKAGEDQRFDSHRGVDYFGIVRAFYLNWKAQEVHQGASTITQQLARNAFNLRGESRRREESEYERKLVEAFLARRIEERYPKWKILEFYLNRIYFGSGYYGLRSASLGYFGKEPRDLTVPECATLVGVIKAPNRLSPLNNMEASRQARNQVLGRMRIDGMITREQESVWSKQPVVLNPRPLERNTTHLYERIAEEMRVRLGEEIWSAGGFRIHTTIDGTTQQVAFEALRATLDRAEEQPGYRHQRRRNFRRDSGEAPQYVQGAVLMVDHRTGEVLAHVGGRDYAHAPFDFIEQGRRPAGTVFFPFIYAAGFEAGLTPATSVEDEAMDNRSVMVGGREGILGEWGMETASPSYEGTIPARRAFEVSKIAATVRFGSRAGLEHVLATARKFGFCTTETELLPRILVGWESVSLPELVRAFAAFARGGELGPDRLVYIDRIEDASGEPVFRRARTPVARERATDAATAFQIHSLMQGSLERGNAAAGANGLLPQPFPGAGKTGSTHDFSDCWFVGYNSRVTCGVWVGFLQAAGKPIYEGAFGRDLAMPAWVAAMNAARPVFGGEPIEPPPNLQQVEVCRISGQRATRYCYETLEDPVTGVPSTRPTAVNDWFRKDGPALPFCAVHGGGEEIDAGPVATGEFGQVVLNAVPIRPRAPVLLGEDPYNSESVATTGAGDGSSDPPATFPRRTTLLDSLDLGDRESEIALPRPRRLEIFAD